MTKIITIYKKQDGKIIIKVHRVLKKQLTLTDRHDLDIVKSWIENIVKEG